MNDTHNKPKLFNDRFLLKQQLSSGSFGVVYLCVDLQTSDYVALKIERKSSKHNTSLDREAQILSILQNLSGIPKLFWQGKEFHMNCLAMELLNKDLAELLKVFKAFSLLTIVHIAISLLDIIENIHKKGIIHRDIKPENILTGRNNEKQLYLVDFGISKFYRTKEGKHMQSNIFSICRPFNQNKPFVGTSRYASISAHKGQEVARKDDLESLGYVLVYLANGYLPWQSVKAGDDKIRQVGSMKMQIENKELCKNLPIEFQRQKFH